MSQSRRDDSLPDVKPRSSKTSKSKRDDDGDWPSTEWDELSDVDYWTELASDKPFTDSTTSSTTQPSRPDRDRGDKRAEPDSGPIRADRRDSSDRRDSGGRDGRDKPGGRDRQSADRRDATERRDSKERRDSLMPAARASRQTVDAAFAPPVSGDPVDKAFGARTDAYGSTELRRAIAGGRAPTTGPQRVPQPANDDPLTSPSFPRVEADDSRSYRRSGGRGTGDSSSQTRPHQAYPPTPAHPPAMPLDSQPGLGPNSGGYSHPVTNGVEYAAAPLADPYYQPGAAAPDSIQPVTSSYPTPAPAASYLPSVGNGYQADPVTSAYSAPPPTAPGYSSAAPGSYPGADSAGYQAPLPGPSPVGYTGDHNGGYPAPAQAPGGYSVTPAASYPEPDYNDYLGTGQNPVGQGSPGQPSAAQPQSSGFSYSQQADPGLPGQLPSGQPNGSYIGGYHAPTHTGQDGVYQMPQAGMLPPQAVQPGHPTVPYNPASAPYEPTGYPAGGFGGAAGYEADSGYTADPYAVDPYGYPGHGAARLPDQIARLPDRRWRAHPLSDQPWEERTWQDRSWDDQPGTTQYRYRDQPHDQDWEGDR